MWVWLWWILRRFLWEQVSSNSVTKVKYITEIVSSKRLLTYEVHIIRFLRFCKICQYCRFHKVWQLQNRLFEDEYSTYLYIYALTTFSNDLKYASWMVVSCHLKTIRKDSKLFNMKWTLMHFLDELGIIIHQLFKKFLMDGFHFKIPLTTFVLPLKFINNSSWNDYLSCETYSSISMQEFV